MPYSRTKRDPRTKEEFLDRLLAHDFSGDVRMVGAAPAQIVRTKANTINLVFPDTGTIFELVVRRPRIVQPEVAQVARAAEVRSFVGSWRETGDGPTEEQVREALELLEPISPERQKVSRQRQSAGRS